jgi:hypothetical protein
MTLKTFLPSLDNNARNKESELLNSLEILISLEVDILPKPNSELVSIWVKSS